MSFREKKNLVTRDFNMLYFTLVNSYVAGDAWKDYQCSRNTYFDKLKEIVQSKYFSISDWPKPLANYQAVNRL